MTGSRTNGGNGERNSLCGMTSRVEKCANWSDDVCTCVPTAKMPEVPVWLATTIPTGPIPATPLSPKVENGKIPNKPAGPPPQTPFKLSTLVLKKRLMGNCVIACAGTPC